MGMGLIVDRMGADIYKYKSSKEFMKIKAKSF